MYFSSTTHVSPLATIRRERLLPYPGSLLVQDGERVQATDVVAAAEAIGRHHIFDLARRLQVLPAEVEKYVVAGPGTTVDKGELLAQRQAALGLVRRTVRAPARGTVVAVSDGRMLFSSAGEIIELRAGFEGVVIATEPDLGVMLETTGALVQGVWGSGRQDGGPLKPIGQKPDEHVTPDLLDNSCRGAIVVGGMADETVLRLAQTMKVRGLIVGSLPASAFPVARAMSYPVMLTEGFGRRPMAEPTWTLLSSLNGREAALDARPAERMSGRRPEAVIPLPPAGAPPPLPVEGVPLEEGRRVRVLRPPFAGAVGIMGPILPRVQVCPSKVQAPSAVVELDGYGAAVVPLANLELFE